ncbi:MAG: glycoside hydrolase family 32 protein [Chloroflexota bacterium]|nr:glycoside hydrolase family 32 protein [Chloroflexota bacterium]
MANDLHRPTYHFLPPANWMNDPNGVVQWKGLYHLFYQYNPYGPLFGKMHWGHAISSDLVHWRHLPIALAPTPGSVDEDGCWSGCIVNNNGVPTIVYSGNRAGKQRPCIATSHDDLLTWEKHAGNPVIQAPPPAMEIVDFRDHCVWKEENTWYQLIGAGIKGVGGTALLYRSPDLLQWEYMHPLCIGDNSETEEMWECPDFFPLGDKYVLLVSPLPYGRTVYFVGSYKEHRFTPEFRGTLDAGSHFYAPQTLRDEQGRRILWGWLREGRSDDLIQQAGWAGMMSLPRLLTLRPDNTLSMVPAPELSSLRNKHSQQTDIMVTETPHTIENVQGAALEIVAVLVRGAASACGITLSGPRDNAEEVSILYDHASGHVKIDTTRIASNLAIQYEVESGPVKLTEDERLKLHIFIDSSVIEVFANDITCITERIYLSHGDNAAISLFARGGNAKILSLDIWEMQSIWTKQ